ncbi:MAG: protease modulator HflC [Desulfobacteraceae bacterium]|nr:protease modulator HflC [Desulfobacteraceae bacterium]
MKTIKFSFKNPISRIVSAVFFLFITGVFAVSFTVREKQAIVLTRFGKPVRTIVDPGLYFRLPPPVEKEVKVDLRLRTTASGLYSTQLKDGSIIVIEAFVVWKVPANIESVKTFVSALGNNTAEAAVQLRSILGSSLQTVAGSYTMQNLINTEKKELKLDDFEKELANIITSKTESVYGVEIKTAGIERLMVPEPIVASTIQAMIEDRRVLAQKTRSEGVERAGQIMSNAHSESRRIIAKAKTSASEIEAEARKKAAEIYASAYEKDPELYKFTRGVDTLKKLMNQQTTLILKTDSYPLNYIGEFSQTDKKEKKDE